MNVDAPGVLSRHAGATPDYTGGSLVNLMRSIGDACGAPKSAYMPCANLDARLQAAERIVLLVIDGLGDLVLEQVGPESVFSAYRERRLTSVFPPTTATAVTTLMSGLAPRQHGLTGWFMHLRRHGVVSAILPFISRYGNRPLAMDGVDIADVVDCTNFFDQIPADSLALMPLAIVDSAFSQRMCGRAVRQGYRDLDDFVARLLHICRGGEQAKFVYAYWSDFDYLCHMCGPSDPRAAQHVAALDRAMRPVFAACAASGTVLLATADHGFIDTGDAERVDVDAHPVLADMLSLPVCGEPRAAYCYVRAGAADEFEDYAAQHLAAELICVPSIDLIDAGWFGPGQAHSELRARVGDYTLLMRGQHAIFDRLPGERGTRLRGVHGGTSTAEMYVPLAIAGP